MFFHWFGMYDIAHMLVSICSIFYLWSLYINISSMTLTIYLTNEEFNYISDLLGISMYWWHHFPFLSIQGRQFVSWQCKMISLTILFNIITTTHSYWCHLHSNICWVSFFYLTRHHWSHHEILPAIKNELYFLLDWNEGIFLERWAFLCQSLKFFGLTHAMNKCH